MPSILGDTHSHVIQGGQVTFTQLFETYPGSGQPADAASVTIGITASGAAGSGSGTPVPTTSAGVTTAGGSASEWQYVWAVLASQATGDYLVTWTGVVSAVTLTYVRTVTVDMVATGSPAPGVYAGPADYQAWSGDTATPASIVATMLQRASEDIDNAVVGAVYKTNANGMPADAVVIDALKRACCAQCQFLLADNDIAGVKRQYLSTNVGGVAAARAPVTAAATFPPLGPRALQILHTTGVLPSAALIAW